MMINKKISTVILVSVIYSFGYNLIVGCNQEKKPGLDQEIISERRDFYKTGKPYTRWWWFATEIKKRDIRHQLNWVKKNNFGGVEVAWVYPLYRFNRKVYPNAKMKVDTSAQKWLSPEWSDVVTYVKHYADSIGLGCDFTFGSGWPFGDSYVSKEHGTKIYGDTAFEQMIHFSWEYPVYGRAMNHLDSNALKRYAERTADGLSDALKGSVSALLCESWEIKLNAGNKLWTAGFDEAFKKRFGYDIIPYMEDSLDNFPDVRYDYMVLLSDYVIGNFYKPYAQICQDLGAISRVQCLASPTDVMEAYAYTDVPETEAMLNNPNYSRIVSSAATLASKVTVSSEAFTCLYGFSKTYHREEQTADLKLVADALFANGVNQIFWHGMPYNPKGVDSVYFFATVHVGSDGSLAEEMPAFNSYMERVSNIMKQGQTYSDVAVYIPYEDGVMAGPYPKERQRVWVWGQYEMRYVDPPEKLEGYHPLWVNRYFLQNAKYKEGILHSGDARFSSLYIDVEYLDSDALTTILELAQKGLPVCLKKLPQEPGKMKSGTYEERLKILNSLGNVSENFEEIAVNPPLVAGDSLPAFWSRVLNNELLIFFAHPLAKNLKYPISSGQSFADESVFREIQVTVNGKTTEVVLAFKPYQSLLLKIGGDGSIGFLDIAFVPKDPVVKPITPQRMNF